MIMLTMAIFPLRGSRLRFGLPMIGDGTYEATREARVSPPMPSTLSLLAAWLYVAVAASCAAGLIAAVRQRQVRWHVVGWTLMALLFILLSGLRIIAFEDLLREALRDLLREQGAYDDRRSVQGPIFAVIFVTGAILGALWLHVTARTISGRRNVALAVALGCGLGLILLILLRILSLHAVDEVLYGPFKLNWFLDLGASAVVFVSGVYYWRVVTGRVR